jgi:hypothetical protein
LLWDVFFLAERVDFETSPQWGRVDLKLKLPLLWDVFFPGGEGGI